MITSKSPSEIDSISIREIEMKTGETQHGMPFLQLSARYSLLISQKGLAVADAKRVHWGEQTLTKLRELLACMEADVCEDVFGKRPTIDGSAPEDDPNSDGVEGL